MKRRIAVLLAAVVAAMAFSTAASADDLGPCNDQGPGNSGYATHHIAFLAKTGGIGQPGVDHNPGTGHQGFSFCLGVHR
jgi:hypothetical protein